MARLPSQAVIQESPISASLDSLTEIILGIAAQEGRAREAEKDRKFQESQMYLESNLEALNKAREEHYNLRNRATELGIMELSLNKLGDVNKTNAFKAIVDNEAGAITNSLNALNQLNNEMQGNISSFSRGRTVAKNIDTDISGDVSSDELLKYKEDEDKIRAEQGLLPIPFGEAFKMGIQSWTMDPDKRLEMALKSEDIKQQQIIGKYLDEQTRIEIEAGKLTNEEIGQRIEMAKVKIGQEELILEKMPEKLANEVEEGKLKINVGELNLQQARHTLALSKLHDSDRIEGEINLRAAQIRELNQKLEQMDYAIDFDLLEKSIQGFDVLYDQAIKDRSGIANEALNQTMIQIDDQIYPFGIYVQKFISDPTDTDVNDFLDAFKGSPMHTEIYNDFMKLKSDIFKGKEDDQIDDYSLFLKSLNKIYSEKDIYEKELNTRYPDGMTLLNKIEEKMRTTKPFRGTSDERHQWNSANKVITELQDKGEISAEEARKLLRLTQLDVSGIWKHSKELKDNVSGSIKEVDALSEQRKKAWQKYQTEAAKGLVQ